MDTHEARAEEILHEIGDRLETSPRKLLVPTAQQTGVTGIAAGSGQTIWAR